MSNEALNTLILSAFLAVVLGGGYFVTGRAQPARLAELTAQIEAIENRSADVERLMAEEALASEEAAATLKRYSSRYKVLPAELTSADVVAYLNALSARGFERFDLSLGGLTPGATASYYTYQINGLAYFESLYGFIWNVENGRGLYRVRDLSIKKELTNLRRPDGTERQVLLAQFSMAVDAYFGGARVMSAPDSAVAPPPEAFPARRAAVNPFFPFIFETLAPNSDDLVDIETDALVSVIGGAAVFERNGELRQLRPGDRVYLGRIASVDPNVARVVIDMNRGGIRERVELDLQTGERYRQAIGRQNLIPNRGTTVIPAGPTLDRPPPAPGTPEARGAALYAAPEGADNEARPPARPYAPAALPRP